MDLRLCWPHTEPLTERFVDGRLLDRVSENIAFDVKGDRT